MKLNELEYIVSLLKSIEDYKESIKISYIDISLRNKYNRISFYVSVTEENYKEVESHVRKCINEKEFNIGFMPDIGGTPILNSIEEVQKLCFSFVHCINVILTSRS